MPNRNQNIHGQCIMKQIHQMTDVTLYSKLVKALVSTRFPLTKQMEQAQCPMAWSLPAPNVFLLKHQVPIITVPKSVHTHNPIHSSVFL